METITSQNIKEVVKEFGKSLLSTEGWYLIVKKEFVDGIRKWLDSYVYTIEGEWLSYSLQKSINETEVYILHLYSRWLTE